LIDATVMFIDVCGFTALPKQVRQTPVTLLNGLFDNIVKEIIAQGGHVDNLWVMPSCRFFARNHLDKAIDVALLYVSS